jgi:hypothetical protein
MTHTGREKAMKRLWLVAVLAIFTVSLGCGGGGGAKGAATALLEAQKTGDVEAAMEYMDLEGIYAEMKKMTEGMGEMAVEMPKFEEWKKQFIAEAKKDAKPNKDFAYEIVEATETGDTATVKVKTKDKKDAEWKENTVTFKKIGGKWKLTVESMKALGE